MNNLNGFELAGRPMKVNHVTERDTSGAGGGGGAMEMLDGEDTDVGVGMTPQSRASLMAKLAEGHNAGVYRCLSRILCTSVSCPSRPYSHKDFLKKLAGEIDKI